MILPFSMDDLLALIHSTRPIIMDAYAARQVTVKGLADYVTAVDLGVQHYLEAALPRLCSDAQLLAEEEARWRIDPVRPFWVLDPIDGTTNLMHDYQQSCVALAYCAEGAIQCAVVYNPFREETFSAVRGEGARLNGSPIRVSNRPDLAHSLAVFGTTPYDKSKSVSVFERARRLFCASEDVRRGGSAELDLCYVACGRSECFVELNLKPWDFCAGMLILEEAGGRLTDEAGNPPCLYRNSDVVASNGLVHQELLALLGEVSV
ncbi:MAG: inositol monophosphatase [Clostridiales bacterium]|nr:inositol monophosphatase [Clostridiales bacterium]